MRKQLFFATGLVALFATAPVQAQWLYEPGWGEPAPIPRATIGPQRRTLPPNLYRDPRFIDDECDVQPRHRNSARGTYMA